MKKQLVVASVTCSKFFIALNLSRNSYITSLTKIEPTSLTKIEPTSLTKIEPNYISILQTIYKKIKSNHVPIYPFIKVKRIGLDQSDVLYKK